MPLNPLSPNIKTQILLTDLQVFLQYYFGEFVKRSKHFPLMIILSILTACCLDSELIL